MKTESHRSPESVVREIKRKTRRKYNAEEKIRIVLEGLKGEESIAAICRREGISPNLYYRWSKAFLEGEKRRLQGDTRREVSPGAVRPERVIFSPPPFDNHLSLLKSIENLPG